MTLVVDASLVIAALVDDGATGTWALDQLEGEHLVAPHLLQVEVANILRRSSLAGDISVETASLAHRDLLGLGVDLVPYGSLADRVWELRENITVYDASYVALAETLRCPLATLDRRLSRAPGPRCTFALPN